MITALLKSGVKDANGIIYSPELLRDLYAEFLMKEHDQPNISLGSFFHAYELGSVNLSEVTHIVKNLRLENDSELRDHRGVDLGADLGIAESRKASLVAELEILNTPPGKSLEALYADGLSIGIVPRFTGTVNFDGEVDRIDELISFDVVVGGKRIA